MISRKFGEDFLMRFQLVDKILELVPDQRIVTAKNLTLGEEYLADHFPAFPELYCAGTYWFSHCSTPLLLRTVKLA